METHRAVGRVVVPIHQIIDLHTRTQPYSLAPGLVALHEFVGDFDGRDLGAGADAGVPHSVLVHRELRRDHLPRLDRDQRTGDDVAHVRIGATAAQEARRCDVELGRVVALPEVLRLHVPLLGRLRIGVAWRAVVQRGARAVAQAVAQRELRDELPPGELQRTHEPWLERR